jgi:hypothetical protein
MGDDFQRPSESYLIQISFLNIDNLSSKLMKDLRASFSTLNYYREKLLQNFYCTSVS